MNIASYRQQILRVLSNTSMGEKNRDSYSSCKVRQSVSNKSNLIYMKCLADHQTSGRPIHRSEDWEGRRSVRRRTSWFQPGGECSELSSVIFVQSTPGSILNKTL